jgi:cellulose biosynthesis protein BcsQ
MNKGRFMDDDFQVISMVNAKGGPGKTSLTKILISTGLAAGRDVVFFDGDPTGNLTAWKDAAVEAGNWPDNCKGYSVKTVAEVIHALNDLVSQNFVGLVFVDTPGVADISTLTLISNSDCVIIPTGLGTDSVQTTFETAKAIEDFLTTLEPGHRPVVKIVRNNLRRDMTKKHLHRYDELSEHPYCSKAGISYHSVVETWDNEGPLLERYKREQASTETMTALNAKNVYKVLDEGRAVINELFDEVSAR